MDHSQWVVVDLDGTLCNCSHRVSYAQIGEWDTFHSKCIDDEPYWPVVRAIEALQIKFNIMVVSGRSESELQNTMRWFKLWNVPEVDALMLRPKNDYRSDIELKTGLLEHWFGGKEAVLKSVVFCLDDRDKVVEGLRNYGLTVFQTRQGDY